MEYKDASRSSYVRSTSDSRQRNPTFFKNNMHGASNFRRDYSEQKQTLISNNSIRNQQDLNQISNMRTARRFPPYEQRQSEHALSKNRYFVLKCLYYEILAKSKLESIWPTRWGTAKRMFECLRNGSFPIIFISLDNSLYFQGACTLIDDPEFFTKPEEKYYQLKIKWIYLADVPYSVVSNDFPQIFQDNLLIKDGQEIDPNAGNMLLATFPRYSSTKLG